MLVTCPDCQREVSSIAPACPGCGRPVAATTIEQTGKGYKGGMLFGGLGIIVGIGWAFTTNKANPEGMTYAICLIIGSFMLYGFCRMAAWWDHG